jgi:polyhydroxybutyrate depolymerase
MSEGNHVLYLEHDGLRRRYVLHRPPGVPPSSGWPVVMMLDGRGGTPWTAIKSTGWTGQADARGFLAVFPEAIRVNPNGPQHFLDNPQLWRMDRAPLDDLGFLAAVLDDLPRHAPVDARRIYVTGFSNGAAMCLRFAAAFPERIAAIGPVAGYGPREETPLARPVPACFLYGGRDPLGPPEGGALRMPWGETIPRPPVREVVQRWARRCGAPAQPTRTQEVAGWRTEHHGEDLVLHIVEELGHVWPGGHRLLPESLVGPGSDRLSATEVLWEFFNEHTLA